MNCIFGLVLFILYSLILNINCIVDWSNDLNPERWNRDAKSRINHMLSRKLNLNLAKNSILFLGDGMGITTITAGRIRKGQLKGKNGEEEITNMEKLDYSALSKTYSIDSQTTDSAGSATAYLTGVKTKLGVLGLDGRVKLRECSPRLLSYKLDSILKWAHRAGKSVGIVTTTRVTHATPAGSYSHSSHRDFEAFDGIFFNQTHQDNGCKDIAAQLIDNNSFINVIFGGGRRKFMKVTDYDYLERTKIGDRIDNRNLINDWIAKMNIEKKRHKFVWNVTDFYNLKPNQYEHVLGLLAWDHMQYETDRLEKNPPVEPSLIEMTQKAIELLSVNPNGYFLLVEGGKIDHGHHSSMAKYALDEFVTFDNALGKALELTSEKETLIVVTADHSHVFTLGGYAKRGNPILGIVNTAENKFLNDNGVTYTSLLYGNGPGALKSIRKFNLTNDITESKSYVQESTVLLHHETHGGEDVAIFAKGPLSHLFDGVVEQNYIPHAMAYASCIGPYSSNINPYCLIKRGVSDHSIEYKNYFTNLINYFLSILSKIRTKQN